MSNSSLDGIICLTLAGGFSILAMDVLRKREEAKAVPKVPSIEFLRVLGCSLIGGGASLLTLGLLKMKFFIT